MAVAQLAEDALVGAAEALKAQLLATDRYQILASDEDFMFDFFNPRSKTGVTTGAGGHTVNANPTNFPLLTGLGMSMTLGFLGPCGLNTPHTHPRATEANIAINGTLRTGLISENGGRLVSHDLQPGQLTLFQPGAIHFEQNNGCDTVLFVAAFNDEDAGVSQVAQRFFSLPQDILAAVFNGIDPKAVIELANSIPDNVALGADECLQRCGLKRTSMGMRVGMEMQKMITAPAPMITGGLGPGQAPRPSAGGSAAGSQAGAGSPFSSGKQAAVDDDQVLAASSNVTSSDGDASIRPFLIALCVINGVLLIALCSLAGWVVFMRPKRTNGHRPLYSAQYLDASDDKILFSAPRTPLSAGFRSSPPSGAYDPPLEK